MSYLLKKVIYETFQFSQLIDKEHPSYCYFLKSSKSKRSVDTLYFYFTRIV